MYVYISFLLRDPSGKNPLLSLSPPRHRWRVHLVALWHRRGQREVEAHARGRRLRRAVEGFDVSLGGRPISW